MFEQLINKFCQEPGFIALMTAINAGAKPAVAGLPGASKAWLLQALAEAGGEAILVVSSEEESLKIYEDLLFFTDSPGRVVYLEERFAHLKALQQMPKDIPGFFIGTRETFSQKVISSEKFEELYLNLNLGKNYPLERLLQTLAAGGYERSAFVEKEGDFSVRGGIVDIYVPLAGNPYRLEFNGDTLESLREFESFTQRSLHDLSTAAILPFRDEAATATIWDYFGAGSLLVNNELLPAVVTGQPAQAFRELNLTLERTPRTYIFDFQPVESFHGSVDNLKTRLGQWVAEKVETYLVTDNTGQQQRLQELLGSQAGLYHMAVGLLSGGFVSPGLRLALVTDEEIFGRYLERKYLSRIKKPKTLGLTPFADLKENDFVVHENYGIGIFNGIERLTIGDKEEDFLVLKYAAGDRLYVPVEQMNLVQKYISSAGRPEVKSLKIYRLGSNNWQRIKAQVKESTLKLAEELLALYSARETASGVALAADAHWQREFEAAFIYEETLDQLQAIEAVKKDLAKDRPMDRLVCGDVGYGKTEVAMRAAFAAVNNNKQVAVLVPTTILAEQHLNTFRERFADYPVKVEMLSRFRSRAEQQKTIKELQKGLVDIIIGTHRLLQPDVKFKELGLLVVDEEQRFGVRHKEKIKQLYKNVHVLTLSATPIPRTLEMSLTGIRDVSIINNPPEGRLPVTTYVMAYDEQVVSEAIRQELKRNGQVFFVHNRVRTIDKFTERLKTLLPEVRIKAAHGQMDTRTLEKIMLDFVARKFDVIVATTIIESGLDLPNVNTLIVDDATRFGLADLYQLRGRVGRSARKAYSYFLYPPNYAFTQDAAERLKAIQEFAQLGSGFKIAMRDLELRGAGNLLGKEQSGYISRVGFDLYCKLLAENIQQLKGEERPLEITPSINLQIKAYVPVNYVADDLARIEVYKKLSQVSGEEELADIGTELKDRYGPVPEEVQNLIEIIGLRLLAQRLLIEEINEREGEWELLFHSRTRVSGDTLVRLAADYRGQVRFEPGPPFTVMIRKGPGLALKNVLQKL